jgi:hypothetical protein
MAKSSERCVETPAIPGRGLCGTISLIGRRGINDLTFAYRRMLYRPILRDELAISGIAVDGLWYVFHLINPHENRLMLNGWPSSARVEITSRRGASLPHPFGGRDILYKLFMA